MIRSVVSSSVLLRAGVLSIALATAPAAFAQGTTEQREACTEDAVRLCPDTIPDVERTTACMKAHEARLSRRCHRVFVAEQERGPVGRGEGRRVERDPADGLDGPRGYAPRPDDDDPPAPRRAERGAPGPDDDYDYAPRRVERSPYGPEDDYAPRRAERLPPDAPYGDDGYGPRRYLYLTPRGRQAETPDEAY